MTVGLVSRTLSTSSNAEWTAHPQLKIIALALFWDTWEASYGVYTYGSLNENSTSGSIAHAHNNGYKLGIRWFQGRDAPSWMYTNYPTGTAVNNFKPVNGLAYLSNETSEMYPTRAAGTLNETIPDIMSAVSAANYRYHRARGLTELARWLNAPCPVNSAHKIKTHVQWVAMGGHENGTEFSMNYHRFQPNYQGTATLQAGISASASSFKLTGTTTGYPTTGGLWEIVDAGEQPDGGKTERIHVTSFNSSNKTVTVAKRGHSGDTALSHLAGCVVKWAPLATAAAPQGAELAAYGGYPASGTAPFDVYRVCQKVLFDVTSGANAAAKNTALIAGYKQDWIYILQDYMAYLPTDVRGFLAGANLFNDNTASARNVVQTYGPTYGTRLICGTTNFDIAGAALTYAAAMPQGAAFLSDAIAAGNLIGVQLQGTSGLPNLGVVGSQVTPNNQDIVNACEHAISAYGSTFVEMQSPRYDQTSPTVATTSVGGWTAKSVNQQQYLLTDTNAVNNRFVEPTINPKAIAGVGIASTLAFGTGRIDRQLRHEITGTGIASTAAFGTGLVKVSPGQAIVGTGIASTLAFGTGTIAVAKVITGTGIASTLAFGNGLVQNAGVHTILGVGIASTLAFGTGTLTNGPAHGLTGTGIASLLAFGSGTVANDPGIVGTGIASTLVFGTGLVVVSGGAKVISGAGHGIASTLEMGDGAVVLEGQGPDDTFVGHKRGRHPRGGINKTDEEMERLGISIHDR